MKATEKIKRVLELMEEEKTLKKEAETRLIELLDKYQDIRLQGSETKITRVYKGHKDDGYSNADGYWYVLSNRTQHRNVMIGPSAIMLWRIIAEIEKEIEKK